MGWRTAALRGIACSIALGASFESSIHARDLTFEDRVAAQKAIEAVYWKHRIWPRENPGPKPPLSAVMPDSAIRAKVADSLLMSALLDSYWRAPLTGEQVQAEIERIARTTQAPGMLREIFAALHDDPFVIAECLARPTLARQRAQIQTRSVGEWAREHTSSATLDTRALTPPAWGYSVPAASLDGCADDAWTLMPGSETPAVCRSCTAVWTGSEMIVWGGGDSGGNYLRTGGRYDPATDSWVASALSSGSVAHAPNARIDHTAVWTGTEMIVWGGETRTSTRYVNTGGRYNPATDSWAASSLTTGSGPNVPVGRTEHTAVWTGSKMIVWGGRVFDFDQELTCTGGSYDPETDSWSPTSLDGGPGASVPSPRSRHTAVWTGSEMIVWGGDGFSTGGGRYDPVSDTWAASSIRYGIGANVPAARADHTAIWTGSEMIVWGGVDGIGYSRSTGGRFDPVTDTWTACSLTSSSGPNVPRSRGFHTAVWTGTEMIVWGGRNREGDGSVTPLDTGGRYDPTTDTWASSSLVNGSGANKPGVRMEHVAIWTGAEMLVWGGWDGLTPTVNPSSGGRYNPSTDSWSASSLNRPSAPNVPVARFFETAVWTGAELIVWGGMITPGFIVVGDGGRYDLATNSWLDSSLSSGAGANVPRARYGHSAVWTGSEMLVWGGAYSDDAGFGNLDDGGRYNPSTDTWAESALGTGSGANVPAPRASHTAVWTGSEMIVWGGSTLQGVFRNSGGRYDPATDVWAASSLSAGSGANVPAGRRTHTAVWTGTEMIVWGGFLDQDYPTTTTGGRYSPTTDTWAECSLGEGSGVNAPGERAFPSAVWTGSEMIIWGGLSPSEIGYLHDGGRYDPLTDSWAESSLANGSGLNVPSPRAWHTAVWTGSEMIVWGGDDDFSKLDTGGRYDPSTDSWRASSLSAGSGRNGAIARGSHLAVWTGSADHRMLVWGGIVDTYTRSGGLYCARDCASSPEICDGIDNNCNGQIDEDSSGMDTDSDGIPNACDACASILDPTVIIPPVSGPPPGSPTSAVITCDSGVTNYLLAGGCTIADRIAACDATTSIHNHFARCVKRLLHQLREEQVITERERRKVERCVKKYKKRHVRHHGHDQPHGPGSGHDH